jgi:hypothetical protein
LTIRRHEFAQGVADAAFAGGPFAVEALLSAAVKFAEGGAFGDFLDYLISQPCPDLAKGFFGLRFLHWFGHVADSSIGLTKIVLHNDYLLGFGMVECDTRPIARLWL